MAAPFPCPSSSREGRQHIPIFPKIRRCRRRRRREISANSRFRLSMVWFCFFFSLGIGCRLKTWLGGGKCCGSLPLFCWILFGIDFGSVGSFKTLQLLIDKNHLGSFSSSGVGPSRRSQRLQSETVWEFFFCFVSFGRVGWFLFWGFFSSFVVLLRDITQNGIGIPEADANRGGLGAIPHSHREFRPFPILPSVI